MQQNEQQSSTWSCNTRFCADLFCSYKIKRPGPQQCMHATGTREQRVCKKLQVVEYTLQLTEGTLLLSVRRKQNRVLNRW
jgi:hypothetical protein